MHNLLKRTISLLMVLLLAIVIFTPPVTIAQAAGKVMTLSKSTARLKPGATLQLKTSNADSSVKWITENSKVATVKDGLVTAMSLGTVNIKAQSKKTTVVCKITVYQPAKKVELVTNPKIIEYGTTFTVTPKFSPADATYQSLTWSVENPADYRVVNMVSDNKFKAVSTETATIVAYQKETNKTYRLEVYVRYPINSFHIEENHKKVTKISTFVGGHLLINGVLDEEEPDTYYERRDPVFTYSVKDKSIATIDQRGQITGLKAGSTTIIVTEDNGKSTSCKLTVTKDRKPYQLDTLYTDNLFLPVERSNYGGSGWHGDADSTYIYKLANNQVGVFHRSKTTKGQTMELNIYDEKLKHLSKKTIALPYTELGGFYQGEDGNYYAATGQLNEEQNNAKTVFSIIKYDNDFKELGRCNITGGESATIEPYTSATTRMTMSGTTLFVHSARTRYTDRDGLNHQSNISFFIDTTTMTKIYVGDFLPYNHVGHSFNQFVKVDGNNLIYVDHSDGVPTRAVIMNTHPDFTLLGWADDSYRGPVTNHLDLIEIKGRTGDNVTGTTVNGFELGKYHNLVAGVSVPHETLTRESFYDSTIQNVYVSLVAKDGKSSKLIWLTNYKEGGKVTANNLRMIKISEDKFALVYEIREDKNFLNEDGFELTRTEFSTGLILIDSNGKVLKKQVYDFFYTCYVQPIYFNGSLIWVDCRDYWEDYNNWREDMIVHKAEPNQFTRIYLD